MNKREYAKANLDWLAAKAEEEGVIALPEGISITGATIESAIKDKKEYKASARNDESSQRGAGKPYRAGA